MCIEILKILLTLLFLKKFSIINIKKFIYEIILLQEVLFESNSYDSHGII